MIGITSNMAIINYSTHARIKDLKLGAQHIVSLFFRYFLTLFVGIGVILISKYYSTSNKKIFRIAICLLHYNVVI